MKIYTKTGDKGTTMLFGGGRVSKAHLRIDAYGTVDELNSFIGAVRDQMPSSMLHHREVVLTIQKRLFTLGSNLATNPDKNNVQPPDLLASDVEMLEQEIDNMNEDLPDLKHFILPGGHSLVSQVHLARCVCRRTERLVVLLEDNEYVNPIVIKYLNRLSDYLFVLSRSVANILNVEEIKWTPRS